MPRLSPSASRSAWPSASAQSSTVWCSSTWRSPVQRSVEREAAVLRDLLEHVVEEADAGLSRPDDPGRDRPSADAGLASSLARPARGAAGATTARARRSPRCRDRSDEEKSADAEVPANSRSVSRSPMTALRSRSNGVSGCTSRRAPMRACGRRSRRLRGAGRRARRRTRRPVTRAAAAAGAADRGNFPPERSAYRVRPGW